MDFVYYYIIIIIIIRTGTSVKVSCFRFDNIVKSKPIAKSVNYLPTGSFVTLGRVRMPDASVGGTPEQYHDRTIYENGTFSLFFSSSIFFHTILTNANTGVRDDYAVTNLDEIRPKDGV